MSAENETKQTNADRPKPQNGNSEPAHRDGDPGGPAAEANPRHLSPQAQRDEEIAAMMQHSRHQPPTLQRPPDLPPAPAGKALTIVGIALLVLLAAGALTLIEHASHERALAKETEEETIPTVAVVHPVAEKPDEELVLPGSLLAYEESPIYARTSGYLVRWYKDIGSRVTEGELLATIDTPEVDQELNQTRATRQQILAALDLARISSERWENLRKTDSVSAQEADQQTSGYKQAQANLAAADANVRRLEQLEGFKKVYAPFSGVLTKRNVDPGALINAGAQAAGRELFDIARVDPLRVYTSVPQAYAPYIRVGESTAITLQEFPGQRFSAKVARTAESIEPNTRTLLTEVDVPNKDGRLLPGSFGEVHFAVGANVDKVTVPVNAMLFRSQGAQVAVIGSDNKVQLRKINIGKDYGTSLEVLDGLSVGDQVVINPPDSLEQGQQVNIAQAARGQGQNQTTPQQPETTKQEENSPVTKDPSAPGLQSQGQQQNQQRKNSKRQKKGSEQ
jgi:multidrug efflux system membrane fusion protein